MSLRVGIDLGGTKIEIAALDGAGSVQVRHRVPTPQGEYDATVRTLRDLIERVETERGIAVRRIGLATPGSLSPWTGVMRNANSTCLNGRPLDRDVATATGCQVRLANDANCFALAEARSGAGRGHPVVFGVIIGTGVGGGVIVNGTPLQGAAGNAGEWGHNPLPGEEIAGGPPCYCGRRGCIETWCSGPGLAADYGRATGLDADAHAVSRLACAGDPAAGAAVARHRVRLGRALATVVNILDPDVIVLGGGLSHLPGLIQSLPDCVRPHVFSDRFETPIRRNELGDSAGVIGAAWLWPEEEA